MQLTIRRMQTDDAPFVNRLSVQLGYALAVDQTAEQIKSITAAADHIAFVASENDTIIGWIHAFKSLYIESLPFVEVGGLIVDEKYRGKGVGKALMEHVKDWCMQQGIFRIRLRSQTKRLDAHKFYQALGFEVIKEQKVFQLVLHR
jgi:GNAT superfamily N-acetyltransferase